MPLRLTNNPDIALAQEWIAQIHHWIAVNGLEGHDPFDVKAHPWIRAAQRRFRASPTSASSTVYSTATARRMAACWPAETPQPPDW